MLPPITLQFLRDEIEPLFQNHLALIQKAAALSKRMFDEMSVEEVIYLEGVVQSLPPDSIIVFMRELIQKVKKNKSKQLFKRAESYRMQAAELEERGERLLVAPPPPRVPAVNKADDHVPPECKLS